jgi:hypothetical protein
MDLSVLRSHVPPGVGYRLDAMLVVSAYAGKEFFREVDQTLKPRRLGVVLDEGVAASTVAEIRRATCVKPTRWQGGGGLVCARRAADRLMHSKVYVLSWRAPGKRDIDVLAIGSANASRAAWSGDGGNGEAVLTARFLKHDTELHKWCATVWELLAAGAGEVPALVEAEADGLRVSIDRFEIIPAGRPGFDAWLEQGVLCHPFDPDPSFLRISIPLKRKLPPNPSLRQLDALKVLDENAGRFLRYVYLEGGEATPPEMASDGVWRWRSRFFVESTLGHWTSRSCYLGHKEKFRAGGHRQRADALAILRIEDRMPARLESFMEVMRAVPHRLPGDDPSEWLRCDPESGAVEFDYYRQTASRKLMLDRAKALDRAWCDRYVSRFAFVDVPKFRADVDGWDRFAMSVAETLWFHLQRGKRDNVLARQLASVYDEAGESLLAVIEDAVEKAVAEYPKDGDATARAVLTVLRNRWDDLRELAEQALDQGLGDADAPD